MIAVVMERCNLFVSTLLLLLLSSLSSLPSCESFTTHDTKTMSFQLQKNCRLQTLLGSTNNRNNRVRLLLAAPSSLSSTALSLCFSSGKEEKINNGGNDGCDNDPEISFQYESLDKKGEWMKMDYDNIPISNTINSNDQMMGSQSQPSKGNNLHSVFAPIQPSPIERKVIRDKLVYIKRDDLLHLRNSNVSGNKARKMLTLNELNVHEFPDAVVSYGGPQSNAMVALAAIVQSKNVLLDEMQKSKLKSSTTTTCAKDDCSIESDDWIMTDEQLEDNVGFEDDHFERGNIPTKQQKRFVYYTKKLPRYLRNQPNGNLLRALTLGMELVQLRPNDYSEYFASDNGGSVSPPSQIEAPVPGSSLWIPQGGACGLSSQGAKFMANEIVSFWIDEGNDMPLSVIVPGGTCTTALLLSREVNALLRKEEIQQSSNSDALDIEVVVVPCVGSAGYALRQMSALDVRTGGNGREDLPKVLKPIGQKRYFRFGEPDEAILDTFTEMQDKYDIYLDLLYGAPVWNIILQHWEASKLDNSSEASLLKGRQIMYVHSGGLEGISSQLTRYKHKGLIDSRQVQS